MNRYQVTIPPTRDQGSFTCIASASYCETMKQNALWAYNSARAHDGQSPLLRLPAGTSFKRIES